uniref:C2H2-type domain-containing protein n=1 Tax=Steinernema glaseri TaxID=37863 RepID=A0A1I7YQD4_9BILA
MVCEAMPSGSGHSTEAEALVYNFVKRKKPGLLLEMFGEERCQELEKRNHIYDRNSLLSMLEAVRGHLSVTKADASDGGEQKNHLTEKTKMKEASLTDGDVSKRKTMKITSELAVFNYFHERQQEGALKLLFKEKTRKDYGSKVENMGIRMPPVRRIYAHYRFNELKKENPRCKEIWKCEQCKKDFKSHGGGLDLLEHLGLHENIPSPCIIQGCDATSRRPNSLATHLRKTHQLPIASLNSEQYYALKEVKKQFYKKAEEFRDKYFPPEAFIGFNATKRRDAAQDLEDTQCRECGAIVKNPTSRRTHVAGHLNLRYKCVFEGCEFKLVPIRLADHYNRKHKTKVGDLNEEQLFKHKQIKMNFVEAMRKEMHNYFPKDEVPEESFPKDEVPRIETCEEFKVED